MRPLYTDYTDGFWLREPAIKKIEEIKKSHYMGPWTIKNKHGQWSDNPVDVFYVKEPDTSKGHTNYFGIFYRDNVIFITNAISAFSEPLHGKITPDGSLIISRWRHDYIEYDGCMVDGGRDYFKHNTDGESVQVTVNGMEFKIESKSV